MKKTFVYLLLFFPGMIAVCQEGIGVNPPGLKWRQINTSTGRIIFPKGLDSLAFRTAGLVTYQRQHDQSIAGPQVTRRVPQIIQNQSVLPAGFSTPAPWRNEYYITPPANMFLGPISWTDAMEVHEYRHAQQFSMANQGWIWPYKIVMGQTGWLLGSLMTQPLWFREGDAVLAETIFTGGGRGRLPSFHMEYRALRLAGYRYTYEKAHYLSLRNFVPNPYRIGYYMVTKARRDFGNTVWNDVLRDTYQKKALIYPFTRSLKSRTGFGTRQFYQKTVNELDSLWIVHDRQLKITNANLITQPRTRKYTSYRFPQLLGDSSILVLKSSLDLINTFYIIEPDGTEQKLFSPGRYTDDHLTLVAENNKLVWAESGFHERYINKDYSIIKVYDLKKGKTNKLTSKSRYFSPAISPDGKKVFVTETDYSNKFYFLILDATTGEVISRHPNPHNIFITHPRWTEDNENVVCVAVSDEGNGIIKLNPQKADVEILLPYTRVPISRPFPRGDYVFFSAGYTGINNIYALNINTQHVALVTSVRFGAFEPFVSSDGKTLLYSTYTPDGYRIEQMALDQKAWTPNENVSSNLDFFLQGITNHEDRKITDSVFSSRYEVRNFNAFTSGLFNFYGWLVLPNIPSYGIELYTQNIMSTLRGTVGLLYNTNENRFHHYAKLTYAALYPIVELEYQSGSRRSALTVSTDPTTSHINQHWRENILSAGVRLPFRLTQGTHNTNLSLEGRYERYMVDFLDGFSFQNITAKENFNAWRGHVLFSRTKLQALQHVKPRWGQVADLEFRNGLDVKAKRLHTSLQFYFPGFARTHSFNLRGDYKDESVVEAYRFTDDFQMPRGYQPFPFENIRVASANYEVPVLYPDISLGALAFIQRIRTNFFYDRGTAKLMQNTFTISAPGAELYTDLRLFRLFQMTLCFRYTLVTPSDRTVVEPQTTPFQFLVTRFELIN